MAPLPIPTAGVRYRIQNVELSTCLERNSLGNVATLRWRKNRPAQLWTFDAAPNGLFRIINVADQNYVLEATPPSSTTGRRFILTARTLTTATTQEWKLLPSGRESFYLLNNTNVFLHLDLGNNAAPMLTQDSRIVSATTGSDLNRPPFLQGPEDRWNIVEDSPTTLPDGTGTYVIQTLKGDSIQSAATPLGKAQLSFKASHLGEEHKWEITDLGNGKATIRSTLVDEFIDAQQVGSSVEWTPVLSKTTPPAQPPKWDIRKLGNSLFSITVDKLIPPQTRPTSLAITVLNDVIVLKKDMDVQTQQWSILPTDLASFKPLITKSPVDPTLSLPAGEYKLRTADTFDGPLLYAWIDYGGELQASTSDPGYYFKFEFVGGNDGTGLGNVYISQFSGGKIGFLYASGMDDGSVFLHTLWKRDIWRVQISSGTDSYSITHVETSKRLLCTRPDSNRKDIAKIGVHIPNALHENPGWKLIPK